jgi:hypothetical protein
MRTRLLQSPARALALGAGAALVAAGFFSGTALAWKHDPMRLGVGLQPMPTGSITTSYSGSQQDATPAFAFALAPSFDVWFHRFAFVGLVPRYVFNVKAQGDRPGGEVDYRLRLGVDVPVNDSLMLFGYLAPGYSLVVLPPDARYPGRPHPRGPVIGFAAGAMIDLGRWLYLSVELGQQLGFQTTTIAGAEVDSRTSFLHIGLGAGCRL